MNRTKTTSTNKTISASDRESAWLYLPQIELASCIFAAVERNTLQRSLDARERFNYYPASPLPQLSWIFEGQLHLTRLERHAEPSLEPALPKLVIAGPQTMPSASWSPGAVHALTVSFYPQALSRFLHKPLSHLNNRVEPLEAWASPEFCALAYGLFPHASAHPFQAWQELLLQHWQQQREQRVLPLLGDWVRSQLSKVAFSDAAISLRQWQRRIKQMTGHSQQDLQFFSQVEETFVRLVTKSESAPKNFSDLAYEAGFADQSHMGRSVKRVTGLSPARFMELMQTEESFWFYRLLEGHVRQQQSVESSKSQL